MLSSSIRGASHSVFNLFADPCHLHLTPKLCFLCFPFNLERFWFFVAYSSTLACKLWFFFDASSKYTETQNRFFIQALGFLALSTRTRGAGRASSWAGSTKGAPWQNCGRRRSGSSSAASPATRIRWASESRRVVGACVVFVVPGMASLKGNPPPFCAKRL